MVPPMRRLLLTALAGFSIFGSCLVGPAAADEPVDVWPMVQAGKGITEMLLGSEDL